MERRGCGRGKGEGHEQSRDKWLYWKDCTQPHTLVMKAGCSHTNTTLLCTGAGAALGSEGHLFPTWHCQTVAARQTLGHHSEDGVVAADAGAVFLIVLLGVTDLKELRLQEEQQEGRGNHWAKGRAILIQRSLCQPLSWTWPGWHARQKFISLLNSLSKSQHWKTTNWLSLHLLGSNIC